MQLKIVVIVIYFSIPKQHIKPDYYRKTHNELHRAIPTLNNKEITFWSAINNQTIILGRYKILFEHIILPDYGPCMQGSSVE